MLLNNYPIISNEKNSFNKKLKQNLNYIYLTTRSIEFEIFDQKVEYH